MSRCCPTTTFAGNLVRLSAVNGFYCRRDSERTEPRISAPAPATRFDTSDTTQRFHNQLSRRHGPYRQCSAPESAYQILRWNYAQPTSLANAGSFQFAIRTQSSVRSLTISRAPSCSLLSSSKIRGEVEPRRYGFERRHRCQCSIVLCNARR